jgi:hypothetical protein
MVVGLGLESLVELGLEPLVGLGLGRLVEAGAFRTDIKATATPVPIHLGFNLSETFAASATAKQIRR